jgi:hypothetical protein
MAIVEIFNTYKPLIYHDCMTHKEDNTIDSDCEDEDEDEEEESKDDMNDIKNEKYKSIKNKSYQCRYCNELVNRELDFNKHLSNKHPDKYDYKQYIDKNKNTKIFKAYEYICKRIDSKYKTTYKTLNKLKDFYQFILNSIDLMVYECDDLEYISKIFEWENNRGKPVSTLDVIKNLVLSNIPHDKKTEIFNKWNDVKSNNTSIYINYGQKLMDCAIQIYNKSFNVEFKQEESFKKLIIKDKPKLTYKEVIKYFKIIDILIEYMEQIKETRYGRLLLNNKKSMISWEGYGLILLPITYFSNSQLDINLIELLAKYKFRNINTNNKTLTDFNIRNKLCNINNEYSVNNKYDYYGEIVKLVRRYKDISIHPDNYKTNSIMKEWKNTNATQAKMLLCFLETAISNDDYFPSLKPDLEHIYPVNNKNKLKNPNIIYKLGNLTIYEAKNSKNGHKGNRSIKDDIFNSKKEQYKESTYKITRIISKYNTFEEDEINDRTEQLFTELDKYTDY